MADDDLSREPRQIPLTIDRAAASVVVANDLDLRREALDRALQFWPSMLEPDKQCVEIVKRARQYFDFLKNG